MRRVHNKYWHSLQITETEVDQDLDCADHYARGKRLLLVPSGPKPRGLLTNLNDSCFHFVCSFVLAGKSLCRNHAICDSSTSFVARWNKHHGKVVRAI